MFEHVLNGFGTFDGCSTSTDDAHGTLGGFRGKHKWDKSLCRNQSAVEIDIDIIVQNVEFSITHGGRARTALVDVHVALSQSQSGSLIKDRTRCGVYASTQNDVIERRSQLFQFCGSVLFLKENMLRDHLSQNCYRERPLYLGTVLTSRFKRDRMHTTIGRLGYFL